MIATGFEFEPLPNSDVLIRFTDDNKLPINTQIVTREVLCRFPVVVHAFFLAVENGPDAALAFLKNIAAVDDERNGQSIAKENQNTSPKRRPT